VPFVVEGYQLTGTANVNAAAVTIDPVASPGGEHLSAHLQRADFGT
jgi:hypothetical protein